MSQISQQSLPLWQRASHPRGHKSSVEKALKAHRDQVNDRNDRTLSSQKNGETGGSFFPRTMRSEVTQSSNNQGAASSSVGEQNFAPASPSPGDQGASVASSRRRGMNDIYNDLSISPLRSLAPTLVANESIEELGEMRSDEMPDRRSIDLIA